MIIFECDMCKMHYTAKRSYSDLNMVELNIGGNKFQICHKCASELLHKCEAGGEQYNRFHIGDIVHFLDHLEDFEIDKIHKPTKQYKEYRYDLVTEGRIGFINLVNESDLVLIKRKDEYADEEASETITHEKSSPYYIKDKEGLYYITREIKPGPRSKDKELKYEVESFDTHEKIIVKQSDMISAVL